jgi:hypothetical protein
LTALALQLTAFQRLVWLARQPTRHDHQHAAAAADPRGTALRSVGLARAHRPEQPKSPVSYQ